jgi:GR25 family glycosyltransferase involved in LPS biosynthesis
MIDEIHVINLETSVDRFRLFQERNSHLKGVVRFAAVDGRSLDRQCLIADGLITEDLPYQPGSLGCSLSHINVWKKAVTENRVITAFEDDTISTFRFRERAESVAARLNYDFDIIIWGFDYTPKFIWVDFGFSKAKFEFYDRKWDGGGAEFQAAEFCPAPLKIAHSFGLFGYSVSPRGARSLLEYCLPLRKRVIQFPGAGVAINDVAIDCTMCGVYASMASFVCVPPLVIHDFKLASDRIRRDEHSRVQG